MHAQIAHDLLDAVFAEVTVTAMQLQRLVGDLEADIGETTNIAELNPDVVKRLLALGEEARDDLGDVGRKGKNQRPAGWVVTPKPLQFSSKSKDSY